MLSKPARVEQTDPFLEEPFEPFLPSFLSGEAFFFFPGLAFFPGLPLPDIMTLELRNVRCRVSSFNIGVPLREVHVQCLDTVADPP